MLESMLMLVFASSLIAGPLGWRAWRDQAEARALAVRADIHAALTRALGGESLVSLRVVPSMPWREGRVFLSAPSGCESLVRSAWSAVVAKVPPDYDLVVRSGRRQIPPAPFPLLAWGQAA